MFSRKLIASAALATVLVAGPAFAQTSSPPSPSSSGSTSGPASGSPTTLGSGGTTPATPHQLEGVKDQSSSITRGTEQGSGSTQEPKGTAMEKPGAAGTEAGPSPKEGSGTGK